MEKTYTSPVFPIVPGIDREGGSVLEGRKHVIFDDLSQERASSYFFLISHAF